MRFQNFARLTPLACLIPLLLAGCGAAGEGNERLPSATNGGTDGTGGTGGNGGTGGTGGNGGTGGTGGNGGTGGTGGNGGTTEPVDTSIVIDDGNGGTLGSGGGAATPNCGDGVRTADEACDDGNRDDGDGCLGTCKYVSPGYSCVVAGELCRQIAVCGDGVKAASEQCDDKNTAEGDGCSARCRIEFGKKCDGEPSVCTNTVCGDGMKEGAEGCDDGNTNPFDGCSSICLREPNCSGESCTSECGDGLVIDEECDDGNTIDGDGCSAVCEIEDGFACTQEATCERVNGECVLRVPAIFRDFSDDHPDFGHGNCSALAKGIVQDTLSADGARPVLKSASMACIKDAASFAQWFTDVDGVNVRLNGSLVLFDNGDGGYVNRWGANGEPFVATVAENERQVNGTCQAGCTELTRNSLQCDNECRPDHDAVMQRTNQLNQAEDELTRAEMELEQVQTQLDDALAAETPDDATIAMLETTLEARQAAVDTRTVTVETITADIEELQTVADACDVACQTTFDMRTDACVAECGPCAYPNDNKNCTGVETVEFDGNPLFFPVDEVMGATRSGANDGEGCTAAGCPAKVPEEYGYNGWPWEDEVFPGAPMHNFYFTSEVQYWFRYDTDTDAKLDFTGDDDVWVFVNGHLAVDLGGVHVPEDGTVTINAQSAGRFGLQPGGVYRITVFHVERKMEGSSFRLTLSGFEATPSDCVADCGDGVLSFGEECDDGVNDGGYGECAANCRVGEYCGNGIVEADEDCDNGPGGGPGCPACRILIVL